MRLLDSSKHLAKVWLASARAGIVREMEFRSNFLLGITRQLLWLAIFLFTIEVIFANTDTLAGWSRPQVLVVLALSRLVEGLVDIVLTRNIADLPYLVQTGKFDSHLLKPVPIQLYSAFHKVNMYNLGNFLAGIILLAYATTLMEHINTVQWVVSALLVGLGITIYYSLLILAASLVFFTERLESLWGMMSLLTEPLTVPFDIFPRLPRLALTYLLPIAFLVFVPAQVLTGRLQIWQLPVAIVITAIFLLLANLAWRAGLRRYSSASS